MPGVTEFLFNGGIGVLGYFGGRHLEKRDQRGQIINGKVKDLTKDISDLSTAATNYYIKEMDERSTLAETALIGSAFKRINVELHSLCQIAQIDTVIFLDVVTSFHHAVTAEPFGSRKIPKLDLNNCKISNIQCTEEAFTRKLKTLEKV